MIPYSVSEEARRDPTIRQAEIFHLMESTHNVRLTTLLRAAEPTYDWEVKNQARMHIRNNDAPYKSTEDAIRHFLETPTAIGARSLRGQIALIAPFGVEDLLSMTLRPTPSGRAKSAQYLNRINTKDWRERWPLMTVEEV